MVANSISWIAWLFNSVHNFKFSKESHQRKFIVMIGKRLTWNNKLFEWRSIICAFLFHLWNLTIKIIETDHLLPPLQMIWASYLTLAQTYTFSKNIFCVLQLKMQVSPSSDLIQKKSSKYKQGHTAKKVRSYSKKSPMRNFSDI